MHLQTQFETLGVVMAVESNRNQENNAAPPSGLMNERRFKRLPIAPVVVFGLGGLVALAVALSLGVGLWSATENTRLLIQEQTDGFMDTIKGRIDARLEPVVAQANWITSHFASDDFDPNNIAALDDFMRGTLAASPQVRGIAYVTPNGHSRRWDRESNSVVAEDWSMRPEIINWIADARKARTTRWQAPIWTHTTGTTMVLHDAPVWRDGEFLGVIGQIVPVAGLSQELLNLTDGTEFVPFILYDRTRVLAHPQLVAWQPGDRSSDHPLLHLRDLGDIALERIWAPDEAAMYLMSGLERSHASSALIGEHWYVYLYREIAGYGPKPWTIGVYFNQDERTEQVGRRLMSALAAGLGVLCMAVVLAIFAGRRLSRPIQAIAAVAHQVEAGQLNQVQQLPRSRILELDDASRSINQMVDGLAEREIIRDTLGRYVPAAVAKDLLRDRGRLKADAAEATVLFADIEAFTNMTQSLGPERTVAVLNAYFSAMVNILERHRGVVTQFQGDAILATFNVPARDAEHATHALQAALEMIDTSNAQHFAGQRIAQRIGVTTGSVVAGAVGASGRLSYTVHGDAVNLAARLEEMNKKFGTRLLVSAATFSQSCGVNLERVGSTTVRGQTDPVELYGLRDERTVTSSAPIA